MCRAVNASDENQSIEDRLLRLPLDSLKLIWSVLWSTEAGRYVAERAAEEADVPVEPKSGFMAIAGLLVKGSAATRGNGWIAPDGGKVRCHPPNVSKTPTLFQV